jgi:hypothetical protein
VILELSPEARQAIINLIIALTEQGQAPRLGEEGKVLTSETGAGEAICGHLRAETGRPG